MMGLALFHANHGNLAGSGAVISTNSIAAGRQAMRKQKNIRGKETLNIVPAHLIIPTGLEVAAAQLLRATAEPTANHTGIPNIYANSMNLIVEAELDTYSQTGWYMAADANVIDTIEVTYLNGQESPKLESRVGFDYLGIEWRIYHDVGITCLDEKGLYKNPGA